jgi:ArsR family transcriptional regulator, lead/cadmium/zinc/bismuth-responsive transcriptional repressor
MNKNEEDICLVKYVNQELVTSLLNSQQDNKIVAELVEIFGVLADSTRLKICMFLSESELCVCDLAAMLGVSDSAVSHQLRLLRSLRIVKYRREGKMAFYTLDDNHVTALIKQGLDHVREKGRG